VNEKCQLTVAQALEQTKARGIRTKAPKTKHGRRTISLPVHIAAELRQHWRAQQEQRLALGHGRAADDDSVFATVDGQFLSPGAVSRAWIRAMESIGMPSVTLHSLRHTHASTLLNAGVDIITVSRRLGHSSPRITLDVYGHLIVGADDRAAEIAGAAFGNIGEQNGSRLDEKPRFSGLFCCSSPNPPFCDGHHGGPRPGMAPLKRGPRRAGRPEYGHGKLHQALNHSLRMPSADSEPHSLT
jgi:hypothetical protein